MQIHELPAQTAANDTDVFAVDNGTSTQKITVENLGKKVTEDATPAFTSGDGASPSSWSDVNVVTSGTALKTILNRITTMMKNVRWLYSKLGTTDISSIADGTLTGAIAGLNTDKIKDIKIIETTSSVTTTAVIAAHGGKSWTGIGGTAIVPSVPSGYTFVGNVNVACNGLVGVSAAFDGNNQMTSQSVNPYMFNANTAQVNVGSTMTVRLYSVCVKN